MYYFCNIVSNRKSMLTRIRKDMLGMMASLICAVHCMATPLAVLWFGIGVPAEHHLLFDVVFIAIGLYFIYTSLMPTLRRTHDVALYSLLVFGVLCFSVSFLLEANLGHLVFGVGGITWAIAHIYHLFLLKPISQGN
jgi:hypothetical protein